jgi:polyphosphate kinase
MHRNLDRRVEVLVQVPSRDNAAQVGALLDLAFASSTYAWELGPEGQWQPNDGTHHLQEMLIERQRRPRVVT